MNDRNGARLRGYESIVRVGAAIGREPLFHFLVLGTLLWAVIVHFQNRNDRQLIRVDADIVRQITESYRAQYGRAPQDADLRQLLTQYVNEEIAYREGEALGLDKGDEIVRRRVAQKFKFLQDDLSTLARPSEADLRAWFEAHRQAYAEQPRVAFRQLYFSPDHGGDEAARNRAQAVLAQLTTNASPSSIASDAFPGPADLAAQTPDSLERLFGQSEIVAKPFSVPVAKWQGPFRSGLGWHLILVSQRKAAALQPFEAVSDRVEEDYLAARRSQANERAFAAIRAKYRVEMDFSNR